MRARTNDRLEPHVPERTCVLTRRSAPRDQLVRLALGPDGTVAPDVRARAPGRGAWIGVSRPELDSAIARGKLRPALARAFKASAVTVSADLGERVEAALRQAALDRLGMEARAGNLLTGSDRIEAAARAGKVALLVHSADSGEDGRRRLDQAWRVGGGETAAAGGLVSPASRTMLSMALGRDNVVHVALIDPAAAVRVKNALARWQAFIAPEAGPGGATATARASGAHVEQRRKTIG